MSRQDAKIFDTTVRRPQVLLMGNGLTYGTGVPWHELIRKVARPGIDLSEYEQRGPEGDFIRFHVPNTVLTLATSETDDAARHKQYGQALACPSYPPNDALKTLLSLPFDAVLTTNYTYEAEAALFPRYPGLTDKSKLNYAWTTDDQGDNKYLLRTFNRVRAGGPDIWHIHGELRRPSSIILSHDEYARLVHHILAYNESRGRDYEKFAAELKFKSWVDYFLMGDVYILGLGMDFSEFDLLWLLGRRRRLRERAGCGKLFFYEPETNENHHKQRALRDAGAEVRSCGVRICGGDDYARFYEAAILDIQKQVT